MNDPVLENEVIRRWQAQMSMRRIAAELRISRYLAKRIIMDYQSGRAEGLAHPDLPTPSESRGSILDQHVPFIQDLLSAPAFHDGVADSRGVTRPGFHGEVHDRQGPGTSAAAPNAASAGTAL